MLYIDIISSDDTYQAALFSDYTKTMRDEYYAEKIKTDATFQQQFPTANDWYMHINTIDSTVNKLLDERYAKIEKDLGTTDKMKKVEKLMYPVSEVGVPMYDTSYVPDGKTLDLMDNASFQQAVKDGKGIAWIKHLIAGFDQKSQEKQDENFGELMITPLDSQGQPNPKYFVELTPEWFEKNPHAPFTNPVEAALYDIALNTYNAHIPATRQALQQTFASSEQTFQGLYLDGNELSINAKM